MNSDNSKYEAILKALQRFQKDELLHKLVVRSKITSQAKQESWQSYGVPWEILLLSRIVLLHWDSIAGSESPSDNDMADLINLLKSYLNTEEHFLKSGTAHGLYKFMRRLAFQQFWHQQEIDHVKVGRTIDLFLNSQLNADLEKIFLEKVGVNRKVLFDFLLMLWITFDQKNIQFIDQSFFAAIANCNLKAMGEAFFKYFSIRPAEFEAFNQQNPVKGFHSEVHEKSPLYKKPLLHIDGRYYLWSFPFISELITNGIYDIYKDIAPEKFGDSFGEIFEGYINKRLTSHKLSFCTDRDLKKLGSPKQVDFVLNGKQGKVIIEAKAIEASRHVRVNPSDGILSNTYKNDVVKAIHQAHSYLEWQKQFEQTKETFLLIVTYKELFLGNAEDVWPEFIAETLKKYYNIEDLQLKKENIHFVSIDGFDRLLNLVTGNIDSMVNILQSIATKKAAITSKRFIFNQYLEDIEDQTNIVDNKNPLSDVFQEYHKDLIKEYFNATPEMAE